MSCGVQPRRPRAQAVRDPKSLNPNRLNPFCSGCSHEYAETWALI